ncbi:class III extradiol ring-cleavage dioxygenase [Gordonia terrae]|uniref:DODA-type extradiol aromatic ring-opening family dioxygenase n=1 Tax=Gordonia hongkongensis TaxID=1701090 RepID=UPI0022B46241|nr:class III extradiol ring-cleavage dioxygenase [Gordonia terrae]
MPTIDELINPTRPAGAYDDLLARVLPAARAQRVWEPSDGPLPAIFVSHGAPPTLDHPEWLHDLNTWGQSMPKPRAIVVISAHWENAPAALGASGAGTPLYYDFGGFHPRYYTLEYSTPDATDLANRIAGSLGYNPVHQFTDRGLDHGAFIPLMAMYPAADVPVVQVSMPSLEPAALLALGARLRTLRDEGVLVMGSGYMTHSFEIIRRPALAGHLEAFDEWAGQTIGRGDIDSLADFGNKAPGARIAHPTADHFVPLLATFGAAHDPSTARTVFNRTALGNHTRSIQVH